MSNVVALSRWDLASAAYLSSRRALGRLYRKEEHVLLRLRRYLERAGAEDLNQTLFDQWRAQFSHRRANTRVVFELSVYNFCRYRRRNEPACFLPDRHTLAHARPAAFPTIIERHQVAQLLRYVSIQTPTTFTPLRPVALRLMVVLLYTAGLRRGEVARLTLGDVDARSGVLRIQASKFHKSRWVPLSHTARTELRHYLATRYRLIPTLESSAPLLCSRDGRALSGDALSNRLKRAMITSGIWSSAAGVPRVHDFRHSFAVAALLRWYQAGADVQANLPKLALYMGHVSIVSTAYYLRVMPAVIAHAGKKFGLAFGDVVDRGAI